MAMFVHLTFEWWRMPLKDWEKWFPKCAPVAHHLRAAFSDRWVRFHNLPLSKRYPENENDYAILLDRHNQVLRELNKNRENVIVLSTGYSNSTSPDGTQPEWQATGIKAKAWRTIAMHEVDINFTAPTFWHVFETQTEWLPRAFDPLIRLVADGTVGNIMIVAPDCRWLLHPYDGGMDVILESEAERDRLKKLFAEWLSPRPDGL
jgi:hypothetical protein